MLKPISRLRSICKGDLNIISSYSKNNIRRIRKKILHSIPVLSIFVLLGIIAYSTIVIGFGEVDGEVYAADASNTSSLIIDNGTATDSTITTRNGVAYSSHTVQVKADNITGYSLTITGPSSLTNGTTTIGGAGGKTGTQLASADTGWGYGWNTTGTTNANIVYNSFPTTNNGTVTLESSNSVSSIDITRKLVFAAKFDQNAAEGHYRANVKLNLTVTPRALITYSVTYNANGGTGTTPTTQTYSTYDTSTKMYAADGSGLTKSGYTLAGWATSSSATTATYAKGGVISLTSSDKTRNLYAVWEKVVPVWDNIQYMQDMTAEICKNAGSGSITLKDSRDTNNYTVQKLADGNCWMTSNMALDLSTTDLNSTDSDVSSKYAKGTATKVTTASSWSSTNTVAQWTPQVAVNSSSPGDGKGYQTVYGYYYSWCAATAGTCTNSNDAPSSICPKGWKLPKGGTTVAKNTAASQTGNDFANLAGLSSTNGVSWSSNVFAGPPAGLILGGAIWYRAGVVNSNGLGNPGSPAIYWSRTAYSDTTTYRLFFNGKELYPAADSGKYFGNSVRCVAYSS